MNKAAAKRSPPDQSSESIDSGDQLTVRGLAQFLNDLGKSLQGPTKGPVLGEALLRLSRTLRKHQDKELDDVLGLLGGETAIQKRQHPVKSNLIEEVDLEALETNQVKELLFDGQLSKQELIQVGTVRLGISKSHLQRQSKRAVLESVMSAVLNEEAHHIISMEAEKEGLRRAKVQGRVKSGEIRSEAVDMP